MSDATNFWKERDAEGHCTRCGCYVEPESLTTERHECPPGFWKDLRDPNPAQTARCPTLSPELRKKVEEEMRNCNRAGGVGDSYWHEALRWVLEQADQMEEK